ncbi:MAG: hypothetical protein GY795_06975 [Desulfobacterales bacterium]|nr:hypothetical protein [Desulfobacterales bacterium]
MKDKKYRDAYRQFIYDIFEMNGRYQDSVMFSSFTPNTLYFFGCLLWDYLPVKWLVIN